MLKEFREFILRGNVVDLAVAVAIGTAFTAVVNGFVSSFITPLVAAIAGKERFAGLLFTINGSEFTYGAFLNTLLTFLITAAVVFFLIVKPMNLFLQRRKEDDEAAEPAAPAEDVRLLTEIRDLLAAQSR
ncbi:large conductance mechanosensitive channel protein MscL [Solirubrobacter sp. CPCC 204708]|uniref:Large-conductance mechanosensitive channel n=1 Tax=Solirubrobacter deserti TaxID=2282478 RepID=A0ABT4RBQ3_9ACTN|nr:large conductance mechanosensitive channel protein MscL [Solirubrobacter deserti]MBE2317153.1 large conductance mechanosensitive channel protein MscL [Solirubrobacter deserti]MDA0135954.1 large conductance mechanosensitive channel protein MscL [Solirubrobacter deserti]